MSTNQVKVNGSLLGDATCHVFLEAAPEAGRGHRIDSRSRRRGTSTVSWAGRDLPRIKLRFIVRGSDAKVDEWLPHILDELDRGDGRTVTVEHLLAPLFDGEKRLALLVEDVPSSWVDGEGGRRWGVVEVSAAIQGTWTADGGSYVEVRRGSFKGRQAELDADDFESETLAASPPSGWTKEHGTGTGFDWTIRDDADGSRAVRVDDSGDVGPAHNTLRPTTGGTGLDDVDLLARIKATRQPMTWDAQSSAVQNQLFAVAWSPELSLFVATGDGVQSSPDGESWTDQVTTAQSGGWFGVVWSPELELFVAVSNASTNRVMTSPDGETWTERSASEQNSWEAVAWSPDLGLFCAVATDGTNRVMTSPDGETWTARSAAAQVAWNGIAWSPELGLFAATAVDNVMTSPDGESWTLRPVPGLSSSQGANIAWSPDLGLFCSVGSDQAYTSPDGKTWTLQSIPEANSFRSVVWSPEAGLFVAVAITGTNRVMTSPDGETWTAYPSSEQNGWFGVTWSPSLAKFVSVANDGTNRVMTGTVNEDPNWGLTARGAISGTDHTGYALAFAVGADDRVALVRLSSVATQTVLEEDDPVAIAVGEYYWLRFRITGSTLKGKVWRDGDQEPLAGGPDDDGFQLKATDASHASGFVGFYHRDGSAAEAHYYDDWQRLDPDVTLERDDGTNTGATALVVLPEQDTGYPLSVQRSDLQETEVSGPASTDPEALKDGGTRTLETYDVTAYLHPLPTIRDQVGRYRLKQSPGTDYLDGTT